MSEKGTPLDACGGFSCFFSSSDIAYDTHRQVTKPLNILLKGWSL